MRASRFAVREAFPIVLAAVTFFELLRHLSIEVVQDAWLTLLGGREVAHGLPRHESLTIWAHGVQWIDQQWLSQLAFYGLYAAGGWKLALLVNTGLILGSLVLAMVAARAGGATSLRTAAVAAVCVPVVAIYWELRAQSFAYILFAAVLWLLVADSRSPSRRVWLVLPLLALWANLHGSVVLAAALVALRGVTAAVPRLRARDRRLARSAALVVGPALCLFASPYGFDLIGYYRRTLFNSAVATSISEWQPASFDRTTAPFFVVLFAALLLLGRSRRLTAFERLAVLLPGAASIVSLRNIVWFGLAVIVVLPRALDEVWPERAAPPRVRLNTLLVVGTTALAALQLALVASGSLPWLRRDWPPSASAAVVAAADRPRSGTVFTTLRLADWLLFAEPRLRGRVAYDARVELLTRRQLHDAVAFANRVGHWQALTRGYRLIVLQRKERDTVRDLLAQHGVRVVYRDREIVVLSR